MATSTYEAIGSVAISAGVNRISFTNIPATYTDLELVCSGTSSPDYDTAMIFNGDSTANYSAVRVYGDGTGGGASDKGNNETYHAITIGGAGNPGPSRVSINNYATNQAFKTVITRSVYPSNYVGMSAKCWRKLAPINSITIIASGSASFQVGTVISLYGIGANQLKATGGNIIQTDGTYWYHAFTSSGVFTPLSALTCDYLVIAGGGGGGANYTPAGGVGGGGGGAGGLRSTVGTTGGGGSLESALSLSANTSYTVTIGSGGAGGVTNGSTGLRGENGNNSVFSTITSVGGGYGGAQDNSVPDQTGGNGGSGGGSYFDKAGGSGTANQGFAGGAGATGTTFNAGGGGGAGAAGTNANNAVPNGGAGVSIVAFSTTTNTGVSNYYAGGGGGGTYIGSNGRGGAGGGGNGAANAGGNGVANTGGGGGGAGYTNNSTLGGNGGSGLVIVRYAV